MTVIKITSAQNPLIKELIQLQEKSRKRKKENRFLIEGRREIDIALQSDYQLKTILFNANVYTIDQVQSIFENELLAFIELSAEVYTKLAYRSSTEGLIAVAESKTHSLSDLKFTNSSPLLLIAEAPEKPGNIGALLRTADAANVDAVIIANIKTDLYNPNIVRSSVGCVFSTKIGLDTTENVIHFLKENNVNLYCAALKEEAKNYTDQDFTKASAVVVGTEAVGLSDEWLSAADETIIIPMQGKIDSMNVSVSAGILIFEAKRQRNFQ